jgi:CheY-like chemotaxis protein
MGKGELVLVADDETAIRNIAAHALEAFGYKAITAVNGAEAVALCAQHRDTLQILITDTAMPVMDGPAAIRAVRKIAPSLKIVLTSGMDTQQATGGTDGIDAALGKPYSAEQLLRIIHDLLAGKAEVR